MKQRISGGLTLVVAALAWLAVGCMETETALGPVEQAVVDPRLVGEWKVGGGEDGSDLTVRNFNGREYYIEDRPSGRETVRYAGHVTDVKGAAFIHVRPLTDDGTLAKKHVILRVDRVDDAKVNLRQLDSAFFDDKPHNTTAKLRAIVEQNLDNAEMYEGEPAVLTRSRADQ